MIATILPLTALGNSSFPILVSARYALTSSLLLANLSSFVCDFAARSKIGGTHVNFFILQQLPLLAPATYEELCRWCGCSQTLKAWLLPRVLELIYTTLDLKPFAEDCGYSGPPFKWNEERRFLLRCELDAAFFHLYLGSSEEWAKGPKPLQESFGTGHEAVRYVMDTFPIVRRKDEERFRSYRTKETILDIYDAMEKAAQDGLSYQTRLEPPPADPTVGHAPQPIGGAGPFEPQPLEQDSQDVY